MPFPCGQISIIDAFLGVLPVLQNIPGNGSTVAAVLLSRGGNRRLVPVPLEPDDLKIFHRFHPASQFVLSLIYTTFGLGSHTFPNSFLFFPKAGGKMGAQKRNLAAERRLL